jgi:hypothetical protein
MLMMVNNESKAAAEPLDTLWNNYQSCVAASEAAFDAYNRAEELLGYDGARELDRAADEAVGATFRVLDLIDQTPARTLGGAIIKLKAAHARAQYNEQEGVYEFEANGRLFHAALSELEALC